MTRGRQKCFHCLRRMIRRRKLFVSQLTTFFFFGQNTDNIPLRQRCLGWLGGDGRLIGSVDGKLSTLTRELWSRFTCLEGFLRLSDVMSLFKRHVKLAQSILLKTSEDTPKNRIFSPMFTASCQNLCLVVGRLEGFFFFFLKAVSGGLSDEDEVLSPFVTSQRADLHSCASIKWIMQKKEADTDYCSEEFWIICPLIILIMFSVWIFPSLFLIMRGIIWIITRHTETWKWIQTHCNILCCQLKPLMWHLLSEFMFNSSQTFSFTGSKIYQHADDRVMIVAWALERLSDVEYITAW